MRPLVTFLATACLIWIPVRWTHPDPGSVTHWVLKADGGTIDTWSKDQPMLMSDGVTFGAITAVPEGSVVSLEACNSVGCTANPDSWVYPVPLEDPCDGDTTVGVREFGRWKQYQGTDMQPGPH